MSSEAAGIPEVGQAVQIRNRLATVRAVEPYDARGQQGRLSSVDANNPDHPAALRSFVNAHRWTGLNRLRESNDIRDEPLLGVWNSAIQVHPYQLEAVTEADRLRLRVEIDALCAGVEDHGQDGIETDARERAMRLRSLAHLVAEDLDHVIQRAQRHQPVRPRLVLDQNVDQQSAKHTLGPIFCQKIFLPLFPHPLVPNLTGYL
jgi:hypothetical protein